MNALSTHHRPLRRPSRKSSQHRRDDAQSSRFRRLVGESLEDRCLLTLGDGEVGQVLNLPNDAITPAAPQAVELFIVSPALFVENLGQWSDPTIRYAFQGSGANVLFTGAGPVFQVFHRERATGTTGVPPATGWDASPTAVDPAHGFDDPASLVTHGAEFSLQFEGANGAARGPRPGRDDLQLLPGRPVQLAHRRADVPAGRLPGPLRRGVRKPGDCPPLG